MTNFRKVCRLGTVTRNWSGKRNAYNSVFVEIEHTAGKLSICGVEGPLPSGNCRGACGQIVDTAREVDKFAPGWDADKRDKFVQVWDRWHLNDMRANCEHQTGPDWDASREVEITSYQVEWKAVKGSGGLLDAYADQVRGQVGAVWVADREHYRKAVKFSPAAEILLALDSAGVEPFTWRVLSADQWRAATKGVRSMPCWAEFERTQIKTKVETKRVGWLHEHEHTAGILGKPCTVCGYKYGTAWKREEVPTEVLEFLQSLPSTDKQPAWV